VLIEPRIMLGEGCPHFLLPFRERSKMFENECKHRQRVFCLYAAFMIISKIVPGSLALCNCSLTIGL